MVHRYGRFVVPPPPFDTNDMIVAMNAHQMEGVHPSAVDLSRSRQEARLLRLVSLTLALLAQYCSKGSLDLSQAVFKRLASLSPQGCHRDSMGVYLNKKKKTKKNT